MQSRAIHLDTDEHGTEIVRVPLGREGKEFATLCKDDYLDLRNQGLTGNFFKVDTRGYIACSNPRARGRFLLVARLIMDCGAGETVRFIKKDYSDLRRSNLMKLASGFSLTRARDFLKPRKEERNG